MPPDQLVWDDQIFWHGLYEVWMHESFWQVQRSEASICEVHPCAHEFKLVFSKAEGSVRQVWHMSWSASDTLLKVFQKGQRWLAFGRSVWKDVCTLLHVHYCLLLRHALANSAHDVLRGLCSSCSSTAMAGMKDECSASEVLVRCMASGHTSVPGISPPRSVFFSYSSHKQIVKNLKTIMGLIL